MAEVGALVEVAGLLRRNHYLVRSPVAPLERLGPKSVARLSAVSSAGFLVAAGAYADVADESVGAGG